MARATTKTASKTSAATAGPKPASGAVTLMVGTRKGAFFLKGDAARRKWTLSGPVHLGTIVHHMAQDPRDKKTMLMASRTGHLGPTIFRSTDRGRTWKEAKTPPAFPRAPDAPPDDPKVPFWDKPKGSVVDHTFWLTPGHASELGVWWAGTSPQGLFRSADGGDTWQSVPGFNENPMREKWYGGPKDMTPDGGKMHSILIDPRDKNRMLIGMSGGGIFETADYGATWTPLNRGVEATFMPDPNAEYGHDPHCVAISPANPDRLYHQNHCGIYRLDRPATRWERIGRNMPKKVGDIGFPIVLHPRDPDTLWVFPMDGTDVWPRTSPDGKPAAYATHDGGKSWKRQDAGLPKKNAWWTVKRQAMAGDSHDPVGLYFGTTSGAIWASKNGGDRWTSIAQHLPHVYSVTVAEF